MVDAARTHGVTEEVLRRGGVLGAEHQCTRSGGAVEQRQLDPVRVRLRRNCDVLRVDLVCTRTTQERTVVAIRRTHRHAGAVGDRVLRRRERVRPARTRVQLARKVGQRRLGRQRAEVDLDVRGTDRAVSAVGLRSIEREHVVEDCDRDVEVERLANIHNGRQVLIVDRNRACSARDRLLEQLGDEKGNIGRGKVHGRLVTRDCRHFWLYF